MADSDWTTPGEGNWLYDRYSDIASVPMSWADRALALVRGQPYVAPNTRNERQALRANPYAFERPVDSVDWRRQHLQNDRDATRKALRRNPYAFVDPEDPYAGNLQRSMDRNLATPSQIPAPSQIPLPPTIPDRARPTTTEGRVTSGGSASGSAPIQWGSGQQMPFRIPQTSPSGGPMPDVDAMGNPLGTNYDRSNPATPLPHPGQRMGAMPLRHPGQERSGPTPLPPRRDDDQGGMHKVWYDKNGRRAGVGEKPPEGIDPDSYSLEPNKMTGFQRFMRQAWDVDEAGQPKSFWDNFKGKAGGGSVEHASRIAGEKSTPCHTGIIHMAVGGRTDHLPMNVLEGSYVLPADVVSGLGEGNTLAGGKILDNMFSNKMGPGGSRIPDFKATPKYPEATRISPEDYSKYVKMGQEAGRSFMGKEQKDIAGGNARGGVITSHNRRPVPIIAAGGEYVISPDDVMHYGEGDLDQGHEKLDNFVKFVRANTVKTLKNLPGPRKD